MLAKLIDGSVRHRYLVLFIIAAIAAFGLFQLKKLPIDAVPDITNNQVQINSVAPELSPVNMEKLVTFPVETSLAGIPGLETTRSITRNGFSQVVAIFSDDTDIYFARQQVGERLNQIGDALPQGVQPTMGPISTGLGEVLMWSIRYAEPGTKDAKVRDGKPGPQSDGSYITPEGQRLTTETAKAAYLRTVQDWIVALQMRTVPGIAGVDSIGGYQKKYLVQPDPAKLSSYGLSFMDVADALERNNLSVGANYVNRGGEAFLARVDARITSIDQIENAVIADRAGVPIRLSDVASVSIGGELRTGAASENGNQAVIGTALMLLGENSRAVAQDAGERLEQIRPSLPPGVELQVTLDRSKLVNATIETIQKNLTEGALLVIVSLFLLLGNFRAAIISALVIPFSFLMMAIGMNWLKVPGNLMSLGALDFGLIVDGTVIIVENFLRRMAERQEHEGRLLNVGERLEEVAGSVKEMIRPSLFGQAIILMVFAPLLTFTGVEGKTFSPMAITVMLALVAAFILSMTLVPALLAVVIRGRVAEKEVRAIAWLKDRYARGLPRALARPWVTIGTGVAVFALSLVVFQFVGREFIPQLDEKDFAVSAIRIPSTSLEQSAKMQRDVERALMSVPEVDYVFSKTGTAEVASDPMPPNRSDSFVMLKPEEEWPDPDLSKAELAKKLDAKLQPLVGNAFSFTQPIEMRFNELISGVRGTVAISLYGDDLDQMATTSEQIARVLQSIDGAADVQADQTGGFPTLDFRFDRAAISGLGLQVEDVAKTVSAALGGREAGVVFEGDRRFDVVVRMPDATRDNIDAIGAIPVMLPQEASAGRHSVPLRQLVDFKEVEGINQISRVNGKRRVVIQSNVRGRDVGTFVAEAQAKVRSQVDLPAGMYLEWGGQFQSLQAASQRLMIVIPIAAVLIFVLLLMALESIGMAAAIFAAVPLAISGGIFALFLTGQLFSISAAVGFIVLFGVSVLNGLVMMTSIQARLKSGMEVGEAIEGGAMERFRSVLMTAIVPSLGFVPMAIAHGTGAEVQKPLAITVIGGLITATILTLFVLPAISKLVLGRKRKNAVAELHHEATTV
ncbi:efflux RND transporter permease subunit [Stakelama marina]|uniref:CusA/CzcA family heavy metal efflux RND transporter n=1 Tax=Stakelama marina TaxID=2826939 RepID=A0A8T4ICK6_9SPHN|nr:CusA/CzcA family heavy metal efflux RND transporter [Stakelama marina]MBR0552768.1 CusA/CzcA family heavy metal efflux RND transporter [Stakelama marina]